MFADRNRSLEAYMQGDSRFSAGKMKRVAFRLLAASVLLASVPASSGMSYRPKDDNEVIAVDASTGRLLWRYRAWRLSYALFEMYSTGLVVFFTRHTSDPVFLDPNTGNPAKPFERGAVNCLARSATFPFSPSFFPHWPPWRVQLDNGWELSGFVRGCTQTLQFVETMEGEPVWEIRTDGYPREINCWRNFVFYTFSVTLSGSSDKEVVYAYEAGATRPTWTVDVNEIVKGRERPLTVSRVQVIGDALYVQADEHILVVDPESGKLLWHRDLAKDLSLRFRPDFYGGGGPSAMFAKSHDLLVMAFERRVVALDTRTMTYLWHMQPDTFPGQPFPMIHDGKVFLASGDRRRIYQAVPGGRPDQGQAARAFRELDWRHAPLFTALSPAQQLLDAIEKDDFEKAHQLIDAGVDVNAKDSDEATALHTLARQRFGTKEVVNQHLSVFRHLLKAGGNIDAGIETGQTPLVDAMSNNEQLALELIKAGAKVTYKKGVKSPLHRAVASPALVQALIAAGADVNAQDADGQTPLHCSAAAREVTETFQVVRMLVKAGGDLSIKDNDGRDAIEFARYRNESIIAYVMESLKKEAKPKPPNRSTQPAPGRAAPADSPDPAHVP